MCVCVCVCIYRDTNCPIYIVTCHINHVVSKVSRSVNLLRHLSWFLPQSLLVLYLKSYILPLVDYCDVVWDKCSQHDASQLQSLFNYACRLALHRPRLSSSSTLWCELGLSSLCCRRKLHLAELTYKCHDSLAPPTFHPSSVSPPTTITHGQKALSTFPSSKQCLGSMHLRTWVHPCCAPCQLHCANLEP